MPSTSICLPSSWTRQGETLLALIEINKQPTRRELIVFALLLGAFGGIVGYLLLSRPEVLLYFSLVSGVAWIVHSLFDRESPATSKCLAALVPLASFVLYAASWQGISAWTVAISLWVLAGLAALAILLSPRQGTAIYTAWMVGFQPIGWTVSHLLLAVIYYGVITPIGLLMRLLGRDPLQCRFDSAASSYWIQRKQNSDTDRYFRQF